MACLVLIFFNVNGVDFSAVACAHFFLPAVLNSYQHQELTDVQPFLNECIEKAQNQKARDAISG